MKFPLLLLKLNDTLINHTLGFVTWKYACQICNFCRISWLSHECAISMEWCKNFTGFWFPEEGK